MLPECPSREANEPPSNYGSIRYLDVWVHIQTFRLELNQNFNLFQGCSLVLRISKIEICDSIWFEAQKPNQTALYKFNEKPQYDASDASIKTHRAGFLLFFFFHLKPKTNENKTKTELNSIQFDPNLFFNIILVQFDLALKPN